MASGLLFTLLICLSCVLSTEAGCSRAGNPAPQSCRCPSGWTQNGKRCFIFVKISTDWASAELTCIRYGGNLASFHSRSEYIFLRTLVYRATGSHPRTWVGASDAAKDGVWLWTDGSRFSYVSWGKGEPNNTGGRESCMEINRTGGDYINDEKCSTRMYFICARDL